ncbi:hypothetical protein CkaCkLH20_08317 [Colletotrichum karsti]|uniref:Protein disulfide-isomerase n=1 Tax=Colletotrichum karsti TaxID=1095194 RepID=A0A9P6LFN5_9PEZI|nr:uncharacterized protein CkaCkLH20_08317 [Colletotrichum karsti]KAF9874334.1 hypothetical protein CkaCkLH20_08317 [Colletotrichum karsti]
MAFWARFVSYALLAVCASAWRHASKSELEEALNGGHDTLVAFVDVSFKFCKLWNSQLLEKEWDSITYYDKTILSLNCAVNAHICEEHDVRSFPAIRLYRSAKTFEYYRGPRQAGDITAFVKRSSRPVISSLGLENVTDFAYADSVVFILRLTDQDAGKGLYKRFLDLATDNAHHYSFGAISRDPADGPSSLDCFNNLDHFILSTTEFFKDVYSLDDFLKSCSSRLVPEMTHGNKAEYKESKTNVLYFFDFNSARREQYAFHIKETARKYERDLRFVTVDPPAFPDIPASMGLKWTFPAIALQDSKTGLMYHSEQSDSITPGFVENFLRSVADGKIQPAFHESVESQRDEEVRVDIGDGPKGVVHDEL